MTRARSMIGKLFHGLLTVVGACLFTLAVFLVLPLIQAISESVKADTVLQSIEAVNEPPPPPPEEEPEEEEEEEPEEAPELEEEAPPLDLSQLELALEPGSGGGWSAGDITASLGKVGGAGEKKIESLFSMADLDQKPRATYQAQPTIDAGLRKQAPATVFVIFVVNERGRVENPVVQKSTDPDFDRAALNAVKKWQFEPGKRGGKPVSFRLRVPITFPKG